jgi:hypothetical protein
LVSCHHDLYMRVDADITSLQKIDKQWEIIIVVICSK